MRTFLWNTLFILPIVLFVNWQTGWNLTDWQLWAFVLLLTIANEGTHWVKESEKPSQ